MQPREISVQKREYYPSSGQEITSGRNKSYTLPGSRSLMVDTRKKPGDSSPVPSNIQKIPETYPRGCESSQHPHPILGAIPILEKTLGPQDNYITELSSL